MERYKHMDGDSGVVAYECGADYIRVQFSSGAIYLYTYESAGSHNIERMKALARSGDGLSTYINTTVKKNYSKREQ